MGRDISFGDAIHVLGRHVERSDDGIQCLVDTFHDLPEVPLVLGSIGAGGQSARHGCFGKHAGIRNKHLDGINHFLHGGHDTAAVA